MIANKLDGCLEHQVENVVGWLFENLGAMLKSVLFPTLPGFAIRDKPLT